MLESGLTLEICEYDLPDAVHCPRLFSLCPLWKFKSNIIYLLYTATEHCTNRYFANL